jgi:hypothetical protein
VRAAARTAALAAALALVACGDDGGPAGPDANPTDAPAATTLTTYVLDLVENKTADDTEPRPFAEFATLEDVDQDNENAYERLFP